MKIRKTIYNNNEQKVYIYENKKEEFFVVAIPGYNWSIKFSYDEDDVGQKIFSSLPKSIQDEEKQLLSSKIRHWTGEM